MAIETAAPKPAPAPGNPARLHLPGWPRQRLTAADRMLFTERLALLLETGVPLHVALKTLQDQARDHPGLGVVIGAVLNEIVEGRPFSAALRPHPQLFPGSYVQLVAAAEGGGFLPEVLKQLVAIDEQSEKMRSAVVSALSYPAFLAVFSTAVVIFVLTWVFPRFGELFASIRDQLPLSTLILMALSDFLRRWGAVLLVGLAFAVPTGAKWLRSPAGRAIVDRLKLSVPVLRDVFVRIYLVQTLRVLALSFGRGVGAMEALGAAREVVDNVEFRRFIVALESSVESGRGLAAGMQGLSFLPPMVEQMVATGEQTGNLAIVLSRVADFYERELARSLATFTRLAEPIMLLIMGSVVGVMVSALILPIFKLSRAVH